eukprot:1765941-Alexandrium_andersonii.AAC.1
MSASLVGSEMCIRDRCALGAAPLGGRPLVLRRARAPARLVHDTAGRVVILFRALPNREPSPRA